MTVELRMFASGDTDYISKLNADMSDIEAALNALQAQASAATAGSGASAGLFLMALFNNADALIGPNAYLPTLGATSLSVAVGGMFLADSGVVVASFTPYTLNFIGQTAGTHYITVDVTGIPTRLSTLGGGAAYSVSWNGSAFTGTPVRIPPAFFDTAEANDSRNSTLLAQDFHTLDLRLEAGELATTVAKNTADDAQEAADAAMAKAIEVELLASAAAVFSIRKVGATVVTTGTLGAIQVDFEGTIIGWSVIADVVGDLTVEVSKSASSAPPSAPSIPDIVTDKISASAPITLSSAQSAASAAAGVSTWTIDVAQWDVIQFHVATMVTITKATLYLRIQETPPEQTVALDTIASTVDIDPITYGPFTVIT